MKGKNFTQIDDLIKKYHTGSAAASKEAEPAVAPPENFEIKESVEYEPDSEVKEHMQVRPESIQLPPDLEKLGLKAAPSSSFPQYQNIKLPLSDDKIVSGLHAPITSSIRWLATLAIYILRQAHLGLKVVHGHVIRVVKR